MESRIEDEIVAILTQERWPPLEGDDPPGDTKPLPTPPSAPSWVLWIMLVLFSVGIGACCAIACGFLGFVLK